MLGALDRIPFVGREQELATLEHCLADAADGQGRVVLLAGEPGIGKTRLLIEFAEQARAAGWQVLAGRAFELEGQPPYAPFRDALRDHLQTASLAELQALLEEAGPEVALLAPELRRRLPELPAVATASGDEQRYQLFEAVCAFLLGVAQQPVARGLVLVLDDLHWADAASLLLLRHLGRRLGEAPLLIAGAYRSIEVDRAHPLTTTLGTLRREGVLELLSVNALAIEECAALIETASGRPPAPAVVDALYQATDGSPLFLSELVRYLQAEGRDLSDAATLLAHWRVPQGIRAVSDARLGRLSDNAQRLLQTAAVLGDGVRFDVLGDVCGIELQALLDALDEALAAGLLREEREAYSVSHALIRQALQDELSLPRRQQLHRLAAQAIETLYAGDLTPYLGALAVHYRLAGQGATQQALAYARRAGAAALAVSAWEEAAQHWQTALDLVGSADAEGRCTLLLAAGEARQRAGDSATARDSFQQAAELARGLGAGTLLARAALGYAGLGAVYGQSDASTIALLEEALAGVGDGDSALRCQLLGRLALELIYTDDEARREALSEAALAAARRLGDAQALVHALSARRQILADPDRLPQRLALTTEILAIVTGTGGKESVALAMGWWIIDLLEQGDLAAADRALADYAVLARDLRQPGLLWRAGAWQAMRALLAGRFDEAERLTSAASRLGRRTQGMTAVVVGGAQRQLARRQRGLLDEQELAITRSGLADYPLMVGPRCWLAVLALDLGRREEAQQQLDALAADDFAAIPHDFSRLLCLATLAETCAGLGDRPHAP